MSTFPIEVFPEAVRDLLQELPHVVGSRPEYGALGVLWATALCAPSTKVEIKKNYKIGLNIYSAIVADKGDSKSPALGFTCNLLIKKIQASIAKHAQEHGQWEKEMNRLKKSGALKDIASQIRDLEMVEPIPPWWGACTMGTSEGIRDTAKQNSIHGHPGYIGQFCEELDGWIKAMGKYAKNGGDGGEMGFYLQAYDGDVTIKANKGEKDSTPKFRLGLIGTIQPKVFSEAFGGKIENGLLDRFIIVTGKREDIDRDPYMTFKEHVVEKYDFFIGCLFDDDHPETLTMDQGCLAIGREMDKWIKSTDATFKTEAGAKWWVHLHKMAGILAVLWGRKSIDTETMNRAVTLTKFLVISWCKTFRIMHLNDIDDIEQKVTKLLRVGPETRAVLCRSLTAKNRGGLAVCLEDMENKGIIESWSDTGGNGRQVVKFRLAEVAK